MAESWLDGGSQIPVATIALRLGLATLIGGLIGWDRERHDKPAGLRTHMLVTLGAATFVLLGFEVGAEMAHRYGNGLDPTRVLQGVVGGIGFLGAGSIIKGNGRVSGVTTAASVWVSGSLGAAVGMGAYLVALIAATLTIVTLAALGKLEARLTASSSSDPADSRSQDDTSAPQVPPGAAPP